LSRRGIDLIKLAYNLFKPVCQQYSSRDLLLHRTRHLLPVQWPKPSQFASTHCTAGSDVEADLAKIPAKSPAATSKSVDRHATLRAAILSPSASGLQATPTGTTGSAVQILLQMQQDDASAVRNRLVGAKLASSTTPGNVLSTAATSTAGGLNTTHVLLNRSLPVKGGVSSVAPKVTGAVSASVLLSGVLRASDSGAGQAVPIQLIATSQGVLAIPQNYKLVAAQHRRRGSHIFDAAHAATVTAGSLTKRRSASIGEVLHMALCKLDCKKIVNVILSHHLSINSVTDVRSPILFQHQSSGRVLHSLQWHQSECR